MPYSEKEIKSDMIELRKLLKGQKNLAATAKTTKDKK
jgi:hypothetical protein